MEPGVDRVIQWRFVHSTLELNGRDFRCDVNSFFYLYKIIVWNYCRESWTLMFLISDSDDREVRK
jgi:hypothetical protein